MPEKPENIDAILAGTACVVDAGGLHVCDATKADAELIVEAVNALAGEDTP